MMNLQDLRLKKDNDSKFLNAVISYACEYLIRKSIDDSVTLESLDFYDDVYYLREQARCGRFHNLDELRFLHLDKLLKENVFSSSIIENEALVNTFFSLLFSAHIRSEFDSTIRLSKDFQFYQYSVFKNDKEPINHFYFKQHIAGEDTRESNMAGDRHFKYLCISSLKVHSFSDSDAYAIEKELNAKYSSIPHYKDNWKSPKEVKEIIDNEIRNAKNARRIHFENYKNLQSQKGFPYTRANSYQEYIRFLKTNCQEMKIGKFTLRINDILNLFVPYPLR